MSRPGIESAVGGGELSSKELFEQRISSCSEHLHEPASKPFLPITVKHLFYFLQPLKSGSSNTLLRTFLTQPKSNFLHGWQSFMDYFTLFYFSYNHCAVDSLTIYQDSLFKFKAHKFAECIICRPYMNTHN
jgi:hypothetical protein